MTSKSVTPFTTVGHLYYTDPETKEKKEMLTLRDSGEYITGSARFIKMVKDTTIKIPSNYQKGYGNLSEVRFQEGQRDLFIEAFDFYIVNYSNFNLRNWSWTVEKVGEVENKKVKEEVKEGEGKIK